MNPRSKLKFGTGTPMAILSKKASNIVTAVSNPDIRVVVTSPSFDGQATVQVAYPKKDLTKNSIAVLPKVKPKVDVAGICSDYIVRFI